MFTRILEAVTKHIQLDERETKYFTSLLKPRTIRKRQYLLQAGDVCKFETFVNEGLMRAYSVDEKGQERIVMFAQEGWWTSDLYSFLSGNPAGLNIDALEDTSVLQLEKPDLEKLFLEVPRFERLFRILFQNAFVTHQQRLLSVMSQSAEERYKFFLQKYPGLDQRIPQHQIASFLGITAETLSRIRNPR